MEIQEYVEKMKDIQKSLLYFLIREDDIEENFQNLIKLIKNIKNDKNEFRLFLHLIDDVSNHHFRTNGFFDKVEQILLFFKDEYSKYLTNSEIFNIFRENKAAIYILSKNEIIHFDHYIIKSIMVKKMYPNYFIKEIKPFIPEKVYTELESFNQKLLSDMDPETFEENRKRGQNETKICQLIRDDNIDEFISYVAQNDISPDELVEPSIFETNYVLRGGKLIPSLLEYAAFYGSVQVFKYLFNNGGSPRKYLWNYAIHSDNPELIYYLEEKNLEVEDKTYKNYVNEAIKCHHNDIVNYFVDNYLQDQDDFVAGRSINYYNFEFFPENFSLKKIFYDICLYDYYFLVFQILKNYNFDIDFILKDGNITYELISTPFVASVSSDNIDIVKLLVDHFQIDFNFKMMRCSWPKVEENQNALMLAVSRNNEKIVKLLLENDKVDPNIILIKKSYLPNNAVQIYEMNPIFESISSNNLEIVDLFVSNPRTDINIKLKTYTLSNTNELKIARVLSPLKFAITFCFENVVEALLKHPNINLNLEEIDTKSNYGDDESLIYFALKTRNFKIIKLLITDPRADINSRFELKNNDSVSLIGIIHYSIQLKNIDFLKLLLSNEKVDVNLQSTRIINGDMHKEVTGSLLILAILGKEYEIVEILLKHPKIDVNACMKIDTDTTFDVTPALYVAVNNEDDKIVDLLLSHPQINVNNFGFFKNKNCSKITKKSILNLAIEKQNIIIIESLLKMDKIDVNLNSYFYSSEPKAVDEEYTLPLDTAIKQGNLDIIKLLCSNKNIDLSLKSKRSNFSPKHYFIEEKMPIHRAIDLKLLDIISYLLKQIIANGNYKIDFNQLINMTDNEKIKARIYNGIGHLKLINT